MMGGGDVGLLKVGHRRPKSAKQAEASLAILWKILPIPVPGGPDLNGRFADELRRPNGGVDNNAVPSCRPGRPAARLRSRGACTSYAEGGKPVRSGVIKLSEPDIQTA
jgi:hypothetical protein